MALDVEAVHESGGTTAFDRWLAIAVGLIAVWAAVLAILQLQTAKSEERALLMSSRLAVQVFEGTAGTMPRSSFELGSLQSAVSLGLAATARQLSAFQEPDAAEIQTALGQADQEAAGRLLGIAQSMGRPPDASSGIDPATLALLGRSTADLQALVGEQNHQVDLAETASERGARTVFALSLLALAAVLAGLAGVLRDVTPGRISLLTATVVLVASVTWGAWSVLG